jgi:hypothetical protein
MSDAGRGEGSAGMPAERDAVQWTVHTMQGSNDRTIC